jgi:hypothetical protein
MVVRYIEALFGLLLSTGAVVFPLQTLGVHDAGNVSHSTGM